MNNQINTDNPYSITLNRTNNTIEISQGVMDWLNMPDKVLVLAHREQRQIALSTRFDSRANYAVRIQKSDDLYQIDGCEMFLNRLFKEFCLSRHQSVECLPALMKESDHQTIIFQLPDFDFDGFTVVPRELFVPSSWREENAALDEVQ